MYVWWVVVWRVPKYTVRLFIFCFLFFIFKIISLVIFNLSLHTIHISILIIINNNKRVVNKVIRNICRSCEYMEERLFTNPPQMDNPPHNYY